MKKNEIIKDMQASVGSSFITRKKLAMYLGRKDPKDVDKYLMGLDRLGTTYFVPDVAERLMEMKTCR